VGQRVGVDVLPRHIYSEIPNIRALKQNRSWQRPHSLVDVAGADIDHQLRWLREICPSELALMLPSLELFRRAGEANGALGYGPIEADLLYCFVRTHAPRRMIQVGAGASTWVAFRQHRTRPTTSKLPVLIPSQPNSLSNCRLMGRLNCATFPSKS
jgi:hypothetical protein